MAMDVQTVHDKLEIHELLARYARGVDNRDWELYRSVFTDDAHIDYTSAGGIAGGRDEVAAWMARVFPSIPWSQHYITNIEIELDGDTAEVRAMFYNPMQLPGMDAPSSCGGFYHHDLTRTADGWKSRRLLEESRWFLNPIAE
jgi:3-phenylpropionate/cinnamic acid dioxygenase small subunit